MLKRIFWVVLLLVAAAGGYYWWTQQQAQAAVEALANLQTVELTRGPLVASIGATGTVRANQTATLAWQTNGTVESVPVSAGDEVKSGQILARLEQTSLSQNIILAQADLVSAQESLKDLQEPATELQLSQARQAIVNAEKAVQDAEQYLVNIQTQAPQPDIDAARANVSLAKNKLEQAEKRYKPYENKSEDNLIRASLLSQLAQAQKDYDAAVRRLNNLTGVTVNATDLSIAESNLEVAQARLQDAQETYDTLLNGASESDLAVVQARIAAAEATLKLAHIESPFDGTITQVDVMPGDQATPGRAAFRLDDLSRLLVDVQVSEIDINRIQVGQDVLLTFDAILATEYRGKVVEVAKTGVAVQGVVNFAVTVELTNPDELVKPGMTAAVNIIVSELEDVLLIPNRAVRFLNGERVVYTLQNGQLTPVPVTLGASSDVSSQLLNGDLQVGDAVVLNPPQQFTPPGGGPPF